MEVPEPEDMEECVECDDRLPNSPEWRFVWFGSSMLRPEEELAVESR